MTGLRAPPRWADEYCLAVAPQLFAPCPAERTEVDLAYLPNQRWVKQFDLDDLTADLARGMIVERRDGGDGPYFRLAGSRFDIFVQPRLETDTQIVQAFVTSVKPASGQGRIEMVRPAQVSVLPVWEARALDLDELCAVFADGLQVIRRRRAMIDRALRGLDTVATAPSSYSDLHARVRQRYQALQLMLRLIEQRSNRAGAIKTAGIAEETGPGDDGEVLWVRLPRATSLIEGQLVNATAAGRACGRLRIHHVEDGGRQLALSAPRVDIPAGTAVALEHKGRFALAKHQASLLGFLDEQVEGDWTHLAQLLCEPDQLPVVGIKQIRDFYDERLNAEQRAAVSGAVNSPHAFYIQGPPGTGKTTVIAEVVLQLVSKGERVLLLAPMHVAVDEVLSRVAAKPGILALRISWDEGKVHADLRKYLPEQASRTYLRQARRPTTSRGNRWRQDITRLQQQIDAVSSYKQTRTRRRQAAAEFAKAEQQHKAWQGYINREVALAAAEAEAADTQLRNLDQHILPAAATRATTLAAELDRVPWRKRAWADLQRLMGVENPVSALSAQVKHAKARHRESLHALQEWRQRSGYATQREAQLRAERTNGESLHQASLQHRQRILNEAAAAQQLCQPAAADAVGRDATMADADLDSWKQDREQEIIRLQHRIHLEQRWFALSGLADQSEDSLLEQIDSDLRRAANLICCTTTGITRDLGDSDFDTLIVDEASRVIDSEFLIGAIRARRWILVGDERQLPPYVEPADENHLHALAALRMVDRGAAADLDTATSRLGQLWAEDEEVHQFRTDTVARTAAALQDTGQWKREYQAVFEDTWHRLRRLGGQPDETLLAAMLDHLVRSLFERTVSEIAPTLRQPLIWQRRMIEPIAALVRGPIYAGHYRSPEPPEVSPLLYAPTRTPLVFLDTSSHGDRGSERLVNTGFVNDLEVQMIVRMCQAWERRLRQSGAEQVTASVLTFYRAQAAALRTALGSPRYPDFRLLTFKTVDAIDKVQGQEADLVFLSFCRRLPGKSRPSPRYGRWLQDVRRLNVAVTRARRGLILVGHADTLRRLNGVPAAQAFYDNLFRLAIERPGDMQIVPDAR